MRKPFWRIIIILGVILIVLVSIDLCILDGDISGYLSGIITEIIGILVAIVFVDRIISVYEKDRARQDEKKRLIRLSNSLSIIINQYIQYAKAITNPDYKKNITLKEGFEFTRLRAVFRQSFYILDGSRPAFEQYFESQELIATTLRNFLLNFDFEYFPDLLSLFTEYLEYVDINNPYHAIKHHFFRVWMVNQQRNLL